MTFEVFIHNYLDETGIALGIFLLFLLLRKLFSKYVFNLLLKLSKKVKTSLLTSIFTAFEKPLQWLFIIIGFYVTVQYYPLFNQSNPVFWDILRSGIVIIISWGLYNLTASSSHVFDKLNDKYSFEIDAILVPFLSRDIKGYHCYDCNQCRCTRIWFSGQWLCCRIRDRWSSDFTCG